MNLKSTMTTLVAALMAAAILPVDCLAGVKISGTITGADGKPPVLAHAHLLSLRGELHKPMQQTEADSRGRFEFDGVAPGKYQLAVTAVDHTHLLIPLIIDDATPNVKIAVRPRAYPLKDKITEVKIIGDWNDFSFASADLMQKQPDGTFIFETEAQGDSVRYQLLEINSEGRSINGTHNDFFEYDNGGDYRSGVLAKTGTVKIVFDPHKVLRVDNSTLPTVTFDAAHQTLQEIWNLHALVRKERDSYFQTRNAHRENSESQDDFAYDWSATMSTVKEKMRTGEQSALREYAAVQLVQLLDYAAEKDSTVADEVLQLLPPTSDVWAALPRQIGNVTALAGDSRKAALLRKFVESNPDRTVQAVALADLTEMAQRAGDQEQQQAYFAKLQAGYGDVSEVKWYLTELDPNKRIMAGKPVPEFEVQLLDSAEKVSSQSLRGKHYMMDFWAVWCGPCIGEMPKLHSTYEQFKSPGFEILSLSFDGKPDAVVAFREKKWKMPWLHTFVEGGFGSELAKEFEVMGIPKPILVGPDGRILATGEELRGEQLERTLAKHLGDHVAAKND